MTSTEIILAVFGGSFFGTFLGPILVEEWRVYRRRKLWYQPREKTLRDVFRDVEAPVIPIQDLARACGCDEAETRNLLVKIGARGTTMSNGMEGWYVDRTKINFTHINIDQRK